MAEARNLANALELAVDASLEAGKETLRLFQRRSLAVEVKGDASPVTAADRASEALLVERILGAYPNDGILGEEGSERQGTTGYRWIIDPIDGTRSFVHGVPLYGVLLALEEEGGLPVLGVAYLPGLDEVVCAARDQGAYWNGRRARVRSPRELGEACVGYTGFECFSESDTLDALERVRKAAGLTRGWGDCYGHLLVATGRTDAMLDPIMADWDTSALLPIVEEAGGVFTDWQGERTHLGGSAISASSVELGARLVQIVAG